MSGGNGAYYNEIDADAALILRALIADGVIAPGEVDTRSIIEVQPDDLIGFTQCHFFAGGGLWSVAARMAGWPDTRPIWTASCPCQPFSVAGKGGGTDDARHLWPDLLRLARARRPAFLVGEQVAGKAGYGWLDGVRADLAGEGYASRGVDIPACAVDAPHIRQRLYWVATNDDLANADDIGCERREGVAFGCEPDWPNAGWPQSNSAAPGCNEGHREALAHANVALGRLGNQQPARQQQVDEPYAGADLRPRSRNGSFWSDHEWIACHDGKARRTQPGVPLLVDGLSGRVGLWRVAGNAISPVLAAEVIGALKDDLDAERLPA